MERAYDVVVYGGGFRGVGTACFLASAGKRVLVVEPRPSPGWEAGWCLNLELGRGRSAFGDEFGSRLETVGGMRGGRIDAPIAEITLAKMLKEKCVDFLHYVNLVGVRRSERNVGSLILAGKSGQFEVGGRAFVDTSENGILLRMNGTELVKPVSDKSAYSFLMAFADDTARLPAKISTGGRAMLLKKGIWKGEAQIDFPCESGGVAAARGMMPDVLRVLRAEVPALRNAMVATAANAVLPLERWSLPGRESSARVTGFDNLFASGPWHEPVFSFEDRSGLIADRIGVGERAGAEVSKALKSLSGKKIAGDVASIIQPPDEKADVVVCGGGTAGALAAIASARNGADTLLVEASTCLGGIGTGGAIHSYYHGVKGGLQDEVDARVEELTPLFSGGKAVGGFQPEVKKVVLQRLCDEAGVRTIFEALVCGVETEPLPSDLPAKETDAPTRRVRSVILADTEGQRRCAADVVVDCTGDGDVAALAGADYTFGRPTDSLAHAYSQPSGFLADDGLRHYNFDAGYCDPTDPWDLSRARREGILAYLRDKYVEKNRLLYIAPIIGLRNSRQIVGDYRLSLFDEIACAEFPDVVAYSYSHLDNHAFDYENESDEVMLWVWGLGNWPTLIGSEIPYRSMLPKSVEGVLVACRAMSMDNDAHYQLRMQRDMQRLGEVAGIAAAIAVKNKTTPRGIAVGCLQKKLCETGALSNPEGGYHCETWKPKELFAKKLGRSLASAHSPVVRMIAESSVAEKNAPARLESGDPKERFSAAVELALAGRQEAFPELLRCVEERKNIKTNGPAHRQTDAWKFAVALLGMAGQKEAVPQIEKILDDKTADIRALTLAVRALGRIGVRSSASVIEKLLKRKDIPGVITSLQVSCGGITPVTENSLWKLELAAAESLHALGTNRRDLLEKYLDDPRGYVRRCARWLADKLAWR
ncbi:MAG: FAD-dependent oxidoreductase [Verrucomicrobia bacterium]|nr:FAD-dependent oxidoreductase [Verrucomicrobiota bacterium]